MYMENIKAIIQLLIEDIDKLELQYQQNAMDRFFEGWLLTEDINRLEKVDERYLIKRSEIDPVDAEFENELYEFRIKYSDYLENKDILREQYINPDNFDVEEYLVDENIYQNDCLEYFQAMLKLMKSRKTVLEQLNDIKELEVPPLALHFFDNTLRTLKNDMIKKIVEINDSLDEPIPRINRIKEIQDKEYINVEEFEIYFQYGKESQKKFRTNKIYPLPIFSGKGNKVLYFKEDVIKWFKRRDKHKQSSF